MLRVRKRDTLTRKRTLGPVLLAATNFSVLIDCCIWRVLTLAFSYSCSIHIMVDGSSKVYLETERVISSV